MGLTSRPSWFAIVGACAWAAPLAFVCAVMALGPAMASAGGGSGSFSPGAPGARRSVLPARRERRLRRPALRPRPHVRAGHGRPRGLATITARARPEPLALQPRLRGPDGPLDHGQRPHGDLEPRRRRADRHAAQAACASASRFTVVVRYDGVPDDAARDGVRLHPHRRRRSRRRPAARRGDLVPGQRPSDRQGLVHLPDHRARRASRPSPTACSRTDDEARLDDLDVGRAWSRWRPTSTTATIGEFDIDAYRATASASGTRSTRPARPARVPAHRRRSSRSRSAADLSYKRLSAHDQRPRRRRELSFWVTATPSPLGLRLRRGPHGRRRRLDDAARPERPHQPGHGLPLSRSGSTSTRSSRTTRPTTATDVRPVRRHRRVVGGQRRQRRLRAVARSICRAYAGPRRRGLDHVRERRRRPGARASSSTTSSSPPATAPPRSRTTVTRWTAGRCRARPPAARANDNDWIVGTAADTPPTARRRSREGSFARQAGDHRLPRRQRSGLSVLGVAAGSWTTSRASASRSRTRPGRSTPTTSSATRSRPTDVVVHEIAHQWYGDSLAVAGGSTSG